ncbi:hypothetical protein SLEP1_g14337 [Rubroshorea leprosula]|uniref:Uncharacterized protein n=1 Tax=Rubroshorea leprosula TaxID=152421 RepID=A0AAV5ISJ6_9ROSI|nr:hypothetical protein SLEP1_g14337 [Rubroshorea leprosula]
MVCTFTGSHPPRNEMDEQEDTQLSELDMNELRPMPRNLFIGGAEQEQLSEIDDERTPTRSTELARRTELEERTRVLEMAMGKILTRLIPDDPLIPLLNRDAQPTVVVATRNSLALSNIVVPTKPRGSGKLNNEPNSSKHSKELMRKNANLERQLQDVHKSIDELKSPRSHQQTLDLDSASLNLSITAELYQEGFKIPQLETYDGSGHPDEHLYTYQAIMRIQNANDAMICKVSPATLKSMTRRRLSTLERQAGILSSQWEIRRICPETLCPAANSNSLCAGSRAYRGRQFNRRGQGQRDATQNQKDRKWVGYAGIPLPSGTINMILGGIHLGGQSSWGRRAPTQLGQQIMSISDIKHRPEGVEQKVEPVEPVATVPLNPDMLERTVKLAVHKLSMDPTKRPVVQKRRLFGLEKQVAIDEEIQKLLQASFIRRVEYSEWVSNPMLVKKPNGKWRMCIDFTNLNEACPKDLHPLLNVEKLVERAAGHERMSFLDASSGYHRVIFKLQIGRNIEVYVDDMIVTSKRAEDHIDDLNETFQNLRRAQMKLNPLKCTFAVESGKFLGFIAKLAERCLPFFKALREPRNFQWTGECQRTFDELKQYLPSAPLLSKPMEGESLYLYLGVTEKAMSLVLLREQNKHQKPICYVNLLFRKILQKSKLSGRLIGWAVKLSEYDLKFQPHTTIKGQAMADFLVECLSTTVEERASIYPVWVLYVDGAANIDRSGAGAVLVGPNGFKSKHALRFKFQTTNNATEYEALIYGLKLASELKVHSIRIFNNSQLIVGQVNRSCEIRDPQLSRYASLYKRVASMPLLRCLTPYEAEYAVKEVHEGVCGTHIGGKTLAQKLLRHGYYWPTMIKDAQSYVKRCLTCQFNADDIHTLAREMLSSLSSPWPFAQWGVDLLDPFVKGKGGCTYLVVAMDYFTKWIEAKSLSTTTEKKIKEFLFNLILCRFGIPKWITADNGPQFRVVALRLFCNDYGIELALTSVYTPQSNGQDEFANKIVLRGLKARVLATHSNWVNKLNKVLWSCRTTPSSTTGETQFSLAYGAKAIIPIEVRLPSDRLDRHNDPNNEQLLRKNLDLVEAVREMSRIKNMAYQSRVARFYNKRV